MISILLVLDPLDARDTLEEGILRFGFHVRVDRLAINTDACWWLTIWLLLFASLLRWTLAQLDPFHITGELAVSVLERHISLVNFFIVHD